MSDMNERPPGDQTEPVEVSPEETQALAPLASRELPRRLEVRDLVELAAEMPMMTAEGIRQLTEDILPAAMKLIAPQSLIRYGERITVQAPAARELAKFVGFIPKFIVRPHRIPEKGHPGEAYAYECEMEAISLRYRTYCPGVRGFATSNESYAKGRKGVTQAKEEDSVRQTCISRAYRRAFVSCCGMDAIPGALLAQAGIQANQVPQATFQEKPEATGEEAAAEQPDAAKALLRQIEEVAVDLGGTLTKGIIFASHVKEGQYKVPSNWATVSKYERDGTYWWLERALKCAQAAQKAFGAGEIVDWSDVPAWVEKKVRGAIQ